jgi:hypothetical protein
MAVYPSAIRLYISTGTLTSWEDVSHRVVSDYEAEMGMTDESYETRTADPGLFTFWLDNEDGAYTPSSNFGKGTKVKLDVTYSGKTRTKFYGVIDEAEPDVGTHGDQFTRVTCNDWLQYPLGQLVRERQVETNKRMDEAVEGLLDDMPIQPASTLIDEGNSVFPTVYDQVDRDTTVYQELNSYVLSEYGYLYMDRGGERLRVENKNARGGIPRLSVIPKTETSYLLLASGTNNYLRLANGDRLLLNPTQQAIFSGTYNAEFDNPKIVHGKHILNEVEFIAYPKDVDSSTVTLFNLDEPIFVPEGGTKRFTGFFSDPNSGLQIGGTQLTPLVSGTHYQAWQYPFTASGTNYTANFQIAVTPKVNAAIYDVYNAGVGAWLTNLTQKGKGIYPRSPINTIAENTDSKQLHGVKSISIRQPYQQSLSIGEEESAKIVDIEHTPRNVLIRAKFNANSCDLNMQAFMHLDIGSLVKLINAKPAVNSYFHINGMRWKIEKGGSIDVTWIVKEMPTFSPIAIEFDGSADNENGIDYGTASELSDVQQSSFSIWINQKNQSQAPILGKYSTTEIKVLFLFPDGTLRWVQTYTGNDGQWITTGTPLGGAGARDRWIHLAVTYDASSIANDPKIYITGSSWGLTEEITPSGNLASDANVKFVVGNSSRIDNPWGYDPNFVWKNARVYNRVLSQSEITTLANNPDNEDVVLEGMIWNAPYVRNFRYSDYLNQPIGIDDRVWDRVNGLAGIPHWRTFVTGTFQMYWRDPLQSSY